MQKKKFQFLRSALKITLHSILIFLSLIVLYLAFVVLLTVIPANRSAVQPESGVTIFIKSNGVHTDLVLPTENKLYNWNTKIFPEDFSPMNGKSQWTAFGWGDKGFYLYTPNWSDLKASTAFNALFTGSPTAMHISVYGYTPEESIKTKKITLTEEQYKTLCEYVFKSFQKDGKENFILIRGYHYNGVNDNFYEAEGKYHLFNTCNNWTNSALKAAGVKTAFWAPFDKCVFYHF
jgi:uncharacterized protein (TIGR02117 family)